MKQILQNKVKENGIVKIIIKYKNEIEKEEKHQYNIICIRRKQKFNEICDCILCTLMSSYLVVCIIFMSKFMIDTSTKYIFDFI